MTYCVMLRGEEWSTVSTLLPGDIAFCNVSATRSDLVGVLFFFLMMTTGVYSFVCLEELDIYIYMCVCVCVCIYTQDF